MDQHINSNLKVSTCSQHMDNIRILVSSKNANVLQFDVLIIV